MGKIKKYLVLDCETATLPFVNEMCMNAKQKQKIAIAKPLIYDIGWQVVDRNGNVYAKKNFLIQETFFVPQIFSTAYYRDKRPLYMAMLEKQEIVVATWFQAMAELEKDMQDLEMVLAYNACFDFKKAIPFTEKYIKKLYSNDYQSWEDGQRRKCQNLLANMRESGNPDYLKPIFKFRGFEYPLCDLWGVACERLINIDKYRNFCLENDLLTQSGLFFKTSAETSFQYLFNNADFIEDHTALSDAMIESDILIKALKKGKLEPTIQEFPFRQLGEVHVYVMEKQPTYAKKVAEKIYEVFEVRQDGAYKTRLFNVLNYLGYDVD